MLSRIWLVGSGKWPPSEGLLQRAVDGHGAVVGVVGPPGIGKSRLVREVAAMAAGRGVEVFTAFCESHAARSPFMPCCGCCARPSAWTTWTAQAARDRMRDADSRRRPRGSAAA